MTFLETGGSKKLNCMCHLMMSIPGLIAQHSKGHVFEFSWHLLKAVLPINAFCHRSQKAKYESFVFADL